MADSELEVRLAVIKQIAAFGAALMQHGGVDAAAPYIEGALMPLARHAAMDDADEIAQAALAACAQLCELLPATRAAAAAMEAVKWLQAHSSDDAAAQAVRVFAHSAASWPPALLQQHAAHALHTWACHRSFAVREALGSSLPMVAAKLPLNAWPSCVLPSLARVSRDANWRVRKAVAAELPRLAGQLQALGAELGDDDGRGCGSSGSSDDGMACSSGSTSGDDSFGRGSSGAHGAGASGRSSAEFLAGGASLPGSVGFAHVDTPASAAPGSSVHSRPAQSGGFGRRRLPQPRQPVTLLPGSPPPSMAKHPMSAPSSAPAQPSLLADPWELPHQAAHAAPPQLPPLQVAWGALYDALESLTTDSSHWVKVAAQAGLGRCLAVLPPRHVTHLLLGRYTAMAGSSVIAYDISVALECARSFGGVAAKLGAQRWPELRDAFLQLMASKDPTVPCELVAALPQLAHLLGSTLANQELLPPLMALLGQQLGAVEAAFVPVLAPLLEVLPAGQHAALLRTLPQLCAAHQERCSSWRQRRELAEQLARLAAVAAPERVADVLWPCAMTLCTDPVAAVRSAAACEVGALLAALQRAAAAHSSRSGSSKDCSSGDERGSGGRGSGGSSADDSSHDDEQSDGNPDGAAHPELSDGSSSDGSSRDGSGASDGSTCDCAMDGCGEMGGAGGGSAPIAIGGARGRQQRLHQHQATPMPGFLGGGHTGGSGLLGDDDDDLAACFDGGSPASSRSGSLVINALTGAPSSDDDELCSALGAGGGGTLAGSLGSGGGLASSLGGGALAGSLVTNGGLARSLGSSSAVDDDAAASAAARPPRGPSGRPVSGSGRRGRAAAREVVTTDAGQMQAVNLFHPAMMPVGWSSRHAPPPPAAQSPHKRSASAGTLLERPAGGGAAAPSGAAAGMGHAGVKRHSSTSQLAAGTGAPPLGLSLAADADPVAVAERCVEDVVARFGQGAGHQQRQLFGLLLLGVLAHGAGGDVAGGPGLPRSQLQLLLEQLRQLSADRVVSVRQSLSGLMAVLRQQQPPVAAAAPPVAASGAAVAAHQRSDGPPGQAAPGRGGAACASGGGGGGVRQCLRMLAGSSEMGWLVSELEGAGVAPLCA